MSETFKDSIAQQNVQYPIETVVQPMAGENYSRALIFMPVSLAATYLPGATSPVAGAKIIVNSSNYGTITGGLLKTWLVPFFKSAQAGEVGIAIYDDDPEAETNLLADVYGAYKYYAYFKFGIAASADYNALQVALLTLCAPDPLYSRLWIGTSDTNVLSKTSALVTALHAATGSYRLIYNPDATINPALAQLGRSLSVANVTGTPVGNSVDMVSFNTIKGSGEVDGDGNGTNLSPTDKAALDDQKIGYNTYVGDGTDNVVTEGSLYSNGDSVGAEWVKDYITYMAKVKTANLITRMNAFRTNATYQSCLLILQNIVKDFVDMGRLTDFVVTAPVFADLPTSGDTIVVPNAWRATYVDQVRAVTVYGTLYIVQPTK